MKYRKEKLRVIPAVAPLILPSLDNDRTNHPSGTATELRAYALLPDNLGQYRRKVKRDSRRSVAKGQIGASGRLSHARSGQRAQIELDRHSQWTFRRANRRIELIESAFGHGFGLGL